MSKKTGMGIRFLASFVSGLVTLTLISFLVTLFSCLGEENVLKATFEKLLRTMISPKGALIVPFLAAFTLINMFLRKWD